MQDFKIAWEVVSNLVAVIFEFAVRWIKFTIACDISPSIPLIAACFLIIVFFLGSGFIAATVAEMKEKNRFMHFIGGLLVPYFYPAAIYYFIPKPNEDYKPAKDVEKEKMEVQSHRLTEALNEKIANDPYAKLMRKDVEEKPGQEKEAEIIKPVPVQPVQAELKEGQVAKDDGEGFGQNYFASVSIDENGQFCGPFMINFKDGRLVEASRILNAFPETVELEIAGEGDSARKIRVPYSKISGCILKSNWLT